MSSNVVDGLLEVLSDETLGLNHIILVDENGAITDPKFKYKGNLGA